MALIFNVEITKAPSGLKHIFGGGDFPVFVINRGKFGPNSAPESSTKTALFQWISFETQELTGNFQQKKRVISQITPGQAPGLPA